MPIQGVEWWDQIREEGDGAELVVGAVEVGGRSLDPKRDGVDGENVVAVIVAVGSVHHDYDGDGQLA